MLSKEELLKPRFEVIANYPNSIFALNDIYSIEEIKFGIGYYSPEQFPAIFKKLEWHEKRHEPDLPKYVKVVKGFAEDDLPFFAEISSIINECPVIVGFCLKDYTDGVYISWYCLEPATQEEYEKYAKEDEYMKAKNERLKIKK